MVLVAIEAGRMDTRREVAEVVAVVLALVLEEAEEGTLDRRYLLGSGEEAKDCRILAMAGEGEGVATESETRITTNLSSLCRGQDDYGRPPTSTGPLSPSKSAGLRRRLAGVL